MLHTHSATPAAQAPPPVIPSPVPVPSAPVHSPVVTPFVEAPKAKAEPVRPRTATVTAVQSSSSNTTLYAIIGMVVAVIIIIIVVSSLPSGAPKPVKPLRVLAGWPQPSSSRRNLHPQRTRPGRLPKEKQVESRGPLSNHDISCVIILVLCVTLPVG